MSPQSSRPRTATVIVRAVLTCVFAICFVLATGAGAQADPSAKPDPKADSEGFVPVTSGEALQPGEVIPGSRLVGIAYGVILAALAAWAGSVTMRTQSVEDEIASLRAKLDKRA